MNSKFWCGLLSAMVLAGCSGGSGSGSDSVPDSAKDGSSEDKTVTGTVASGAPVSIAKLSYASLLDSGTLWGWAEPIEGAETSVSGEFELPLSSDEAPYLLSVVDDAVNPPRTLRSLVLAEDFTAEGNVRINVSPISDYVTAIVEQEAGQGQAADTLFGLRQNALEKVHAVFSPFLEAYELEITPEQLLSLEFEADGVDLFDQFLDSFELTCPDLASNCSFQPKSAAARNALESSGLFSADTENGGFVLSRSVDDLDTASANMATVFDESAKEALTQRAPVVVALSKNGSWGTKADSWAGYNGVLKIYNLTDEAINAGQLYFASESLRQTGFWNVDKAVVDESRYNLELPSWAVIEPDASYTIGFNGAGSVDEVKDLVSCNFDGDRCLFVYDEAEVSGLAEQGIASLGRFVIENKAAKAKKVEKGSFSPDDRSEISNPNGIVKDAVGNIDLYLRVAGEPWSTGFNGQLEFASPVDGDSWKIDFALPSGVNSINSWGTAKIAQGDGRLTVRNVSWNGKTSSGEPVSVGFGVLGQSYGAVSDPSDCSITIDENRYSCSILADDSAIQESELAKSAPKEVEVGEAQEAQVKPKAKPSVTESEEGGSVVDANVYSKGVGESKRETPEVVSAQSPNNFSGIIGGYVSDWAVWGREFDVERLADTQGQVPYNHLVYAFAGICGDKGSSRASSNVRKVCQENGKSDFEVVFPDQSAAFKNAESDRQIGLLWVNGKRPERGVVEQLQYLKEQNPGLKVALSVGGWTMSEPFHRLASDSDSIDVFVASLKSIVETYGFDGVDVDWEFPGHGGASGKFTENDGKYFADLVCAVDEAMPQEIEVSSAVGATYEFIDKIGSEYGRAAGCMDNIYLMNYDYFGAWDTKFGHQSSLLPSTNLSGAVLDAEEDERWSVDAAVRRMEYYGVQREKLVVGVANYSRSLRGIPGDLQVGNNGQPEGTVSTSGTAKIGVSSWEHGILEAYDLFEAIAGEDLTGANTFNLYSDFEAHADYYYSPSNGNYHSIDTPRTAYLKSRLAHLAGLGGVFVWTVEYDPGVIVNALNVGQGNIVASQEMRSQQTACGIPFESDGSGDTDCEKLYDYLESLSPDDQAIEGKGIAEILEYAITNMNQ